ncbi:MAG TPA: DUF2610 domain-containing protein [Niabella sp.]|nr:DUF2610 domain-containing protein [Niabella sp.]HOZ95584.1 DUF2610 domain-containing protein [Niabella sp.]HQW13824.1 DUF2610 domain-containing protein [Niabella sp.]HQX19283.1 DUF2610 domain-containing protein [Niabella sp.]HQX41635.1 DUF2610 domain-containing protein [Niabella sp.]
MWKIIIGSLIWAIPFFCFAQDSTLYRENLSNGYNALKSNNPAKAYKYFRIAQIEGRLGKLKSTDEADKGVQKSFRALDELKNKAEEAKKEAQKNAEAAINARDSLRKVEDKNDTLEQKIDSLRTQVTNTSILYPTDNKFYSNISEPSNRIGQPNENLSGHKNSDFDRDSIQNKKTEIVSSKFNTKSLATNSDLYQKIKLVWDSLPVFLNKNNSAIKRTKLDEGFMIPLMSSLDADLLIGKTAKELLDSTKEVLLLKNNKIQETDKLFFIYALASYYYSWTLIYQRKFGEATKILDELKLTINGIKYKTDIEYLLLALIYNGYCYYYRSIPQNVNEYKTLDSAVMYISKAVRIQPNNSTYIQKFTKIISSTWLLRSNILTINDKYSIAQLIWEFAGYSIRQFPENPAPLSIFATASIDVAYTYYDKQKFPNAIAILNKSLNTINYKLQVTPEMKDAYLQKSRFFSLLSDIYIRNLKDTSKGKANLDSSISNLTAILRNDIHSPSDYSSIRSVYDDIVNIVERLYLSKQRIKFLSRIATAIARAPMSISKQRSIKTVGAFAFRNLGFYTAASNTHADSIEALSYYIKSIEEFETGNLIKNYANFSQDIQKFCISYTEAIKLSLNLTDFSKAENLYNRMKTMFSDYYKNYPWDFYLIDELKTVSWKFGEYLFKSGQFEKAIEPLALASYEGKKSGTKMLIDIYKAKNTIFYDSLAKKMEKRYKYQSDTIEKFSLTMRSGNTNKTVSVFVVDRDPDYPYKGIDDQVKWIEEAYGLEFPKNIKDALIIMQQEAWKNETSFAGLVGKIVEENYLKNALQKIRDFIKKFQLAMEPVEKQNQFSIIDKLYELETKDKKRNIYEAIKKDQLIFYNQYAEYLINNHKNKEASELIKKIYSLEPKNLEAQKNEKRMNYFLNKSTVLNNMSQYDKSDLELYLTFCLRDLDTLNASRITNTLLARDSSITTKERISKIYFQYTGESNFQKLFLSDFGKLKQYWYYFTNKSVNSIKTYKERRLFYFNLVELDKALMAISPKKMYDSVKLSLGSHYNSLAYYSFFTYQYDEIFYFLKKSLECDPTSPYPYSNYPHAFLFIGDFERAKDLYLELKDLPFDKGAGYPTYKEGFLADFKDFGVYGIKSDAIDQIIKLLKAK